MNVDALERELRVADRAAELARDRLDRHRRRTAELLEAEVRAVLVAERLRGLLATLRRPRRGELEARG